MIEHLNHIIFGKFTLSCLQSSEREVQIRVEHKSRFFSGRQTIQLQDADSSSEGLTHFLHHIVLLRTGQPDKPFFIALIANDFDLLEQLRRFLHLVNEDRWLIGLEKQHRVRLCKLSRHCIVHRDIGSVVLS